MTLQQLDEVLKTWQGRLSAMAENLLELQADADYRSLTGEGGLSKTTLTGMTAKRVAPAVGTIHELFRDFGALQSTVEQAAALRRELPAFFGAEAKAREIQRLLFTPSITVETAGTPFADRALLSNATQSQRYAPEELMQQMANRFVDIRDAVAAARQAWAEFGETADRLEGELQRLRSQRVMPSALLTPDLDALQARVVAARSSALADPIGALLAMQRETESLLAQVYRRVLEAEKVTAQIRLAQTRFEALRRSQATAEAALEEQKAAIAEAAAGTEALSAEKLEALRQWLQRLETKCDEGAHEAVGIGLRNWTAAVESALAANEAIARACQEQMARRGELQGRWRVLKVKAKSHAAAETGDLGALRAKIEGLLSVEPVDLGGAATALASFESLLRTATPVAATQWNAPVR